MVYVITYITGGDTSLPNTQQYFTTFSGSASEGERIVYTDTLSLNTDRIFPSNPMDYRHGDYEHFMLLLILRYPCFDILTSSASADEAVPETERMCIEEAVYLFFSCSVLK